MSTGSSRDPEPGLVRSALDTLSTNVAVLDAEGTIVATNRGWREFAAANGFQNPTDLRGVDYLEKTAGIENEYATRAATGLEALLRGDRDQFELEYPCSSPTEERWYLLRAMPFDHRGERFVTITHTEITDRKVRETTLRAAYEISTACESSLTDQVEALLAITRDVVETEYAAFSRIEDDEYVFEAVTAAGETDIEAGDTAPLESLPNCKHVVETQETLVLRDVEADAPALADSEWGIESYLGTPVTVDGEPYGTFCFFSTEPRAEAFSEWAVTFVDLLSNWISYEFEHREREAKLQHLKENITDVVWMSTPEKDEIEFISDSYEDVWGRSPESLLAESTSFVDAIHPADRDRVEQALRAQQTHPDEYEEQYRVIQPDGEVRWVHDQSAGVYANGELQRIVGIATDITDRKEHEQALAYQKALLEAQAETTIDGLLVVDSDHSVHYHNSRFLDLWGIPEGAIGERTDVDFLTAVRDRLADPDEFIDQIEYLKRHPNEQSRDTVELADGRWLDRYSAPVIGDDGTHYGRLWAFRDITERKNREQELEQQRDELVKLQRVNTLVRRSIQALQETTARNDIETAVCDALTESDLYQTAWIADWTETETGALTIQPRTVAGVDSSYLDGIRESEPGPVSRALQTGEIQVINDVATAASVPESRREIELRHDHHSLVVVPLTKGETSYGVLVVYAPPDHTISETEQDVLSDLGRSIALAIQRVHSQQSLTAETLVALDFRIPDTDFVFGPVSKALDGTLSLARRVVGQDGNVIYYIEVPDSDPERACELLGRDELITSCTVVRDGDSAQPGLIEAHLEKNSRLPLDVLTDYGASIRRARALDGDITLRAELSLQVDVRTVLTELRTVAPTIELVSKQHVERPTKTAAALQDEVTSQLTEKQEAALKTAYARGYYAWPRESTMEELAETFDISAPTLHYRLRKAHDTVIGALLDTKQALEDG